LPVFSATGVKELLLYLQEKVTLDECQQLWVRRERQYAKRQLTWWKKNNQGFWFDVSDADWLEQALNQLLVSLS
jgi:tRNA dimethylallyltransferase